MDINSAIRKKLAYYFKFADTTPDELQNILIRLVLDGKEDEDVIGRFDRRYGSGQKTGFSTARSSCDLREFLVNLVYECSPKELNRLYNLVSPVQKEFKELQTFNYVLTNSLINSKIAKLVSIVSGVMLYLLNRQNERFPEFVFYLFEMMNMGKAFNGIPFSSYSTKNPKVVLELATRFEKILENECGIMFVNECNPFLDGLLKMDFNHTLYQDYLPGREMLDFHRSKTYVLFEYVCEYVEHSSLPWMVLEYLFSVPLWKNNMIAFSELISICF